MERPEEEVTIFSRPQIPGWRICSLVIRDNLPEAPNLTNVRVDIKALVGTLFCDFRVKYI